MKDDPECIRFILSARVPRQIGVAHMKTKTTGISFKDYNVNTTGALPRPHSVSRLLPEGNKTATQYTRPGVTRRGPRRYPSPVPNRLRCFPAVSGKERQFRLLLRPGTS